MSALPPVTVITEFSPVDGFGYGFESETERASAPRLYERYGAERFVKDLSTALGVDCRLALLRRREPGVPMLMSADLPAGYLIWLGPAGHSMKVDPELARVLEEGDLGRRLIALVETAVDHKYATRGSMLASAWKWGPYGEGPPPIALRPDLAEVLLAKTRVEPAGIVAHVQFPDLTAAEAVAAILRADHELRRARGDQGP